jgi:hypothetical protein
MRQLRPEYKCKLLSVVKLMRYIFSIIHMTAMIFPRITYLLTVA